ncbi:hypothetical protein HYU19_05275, partial [Candidatus Woesearchaeota archaeon]|nr:hypothetical protein [Candidatus Woesearchaeota archaeon]
TKIGCFDGWICAKEEDIQDAIAFHRAMEARAGINSIQEGIAAAGGLKVAYQWFYGLFGDEPNKEWGRVSDEDVSQWLTETFSTDVADFASTNWEDSICSATPDFSAPISYVFLQGNSVGASIPGTTTKTTYLRENPSTGAREFVDDTLYLVTGSVSPYGATKNSIEYADDPDNCEDILEFSIVVYRASTALISLTAAMQQILDAVSRMIILSDKKLQSL